MSKERELLIRALEFVERNYVKHPLAHDIRTFLAAEPEAPVECVHVPLTIWKHLKEGRITAEDLVDAVKKAHAEERGEKEAEPIGVLHPNGRFELTRDELPLHLAFPVKLYTRPEPSRKPMAEEEINKEFVGNKKYEQTGDALFNFFKGVRFAEKHHGIGGGDE